MAPLLFLAAVWTAGCVEGRRVIDRAPDKSVHALTSTGTAIDSKLPDILVVYPDLAAMDIDDYRRIRSSEFVRFPEFSRYPGYRQEIRVTAIAAYKPYPAKFWLEGTGSARVKVAGVPYRFESDAARSIEIEAAPDGDGFADLLFHARQGLPQGTSLLIVGKGHFKPVTLQRRYLGLFQLDVIESVRLERHNSR